MLWKSLQKKFLDADRASVEQCVNWVEGTLRDSLSSGQDEQGLSANRLARILLFYALALADQSKRDQKQVSTNSPKWKELAHQINNFSNNAPKEIRDLFCAEYSESNVGQFATLASRKRGVQKKKYYSTLLFFVLHLSETGKLSDDFFKNFASRDDRGFPLMALRVVASILDHGLPSGTSEPHRQVRVRINVKEENYNRFHSFYERFDYGSPGKSEAHFVVYRVMKSNPTGVMKSFLAISEPSGVFQDKDAYAFSHIYVPPSPTGQKRFSGGKVIPLQDGVYLVGGQRPYSTDRQGVPFSSIKVIASRWHDLDRGHKIFPALTMSTNYLGVPIVGRAAIRATPIGHSEKIDLGSVDLSDLRNDLLKDMKKEKEFVDSLSGKGEDFRSLADSFLTYESESKIAQYAKEIINIVNNGPGKSDLWDAPIDFKKPVKVRGKETHQRLTKDTLRSAISEAMQIGMADEYRDADSSPFDFWKNLRFGPLEIE